MWVRGILLFWLVLFGKWEWLQKIWSLSSMNLHIIRGGKYTSNSPLRKPLLGQWHSRVPYRHWCASWSLILSTLKTGESSSKMKEARRGFWEHKHYASHPLKALHYYYVAFPGFYSSGLAQNPRVWSWTPIFLPLCVQTLPLCTECLCSPQNSYVKALIPRVIVFWGGALGTN